MATITCMGTTKRKVTETDKETARRLTMLWERRRAEAEERGESLTQEGFAEELGMSQPTFSNYLRGKMPFGVAAILNFAKHFQVDPRQIRPDWEQMMGGVPAPLNQELLEQSIDIVLNMLDRSASSLPISKKAKLISAVYKDGLRSGTVHEEYARGVFEGLRAAQPSQM